MSDVQKLYALRFNKTGLQKRHRVWKMLCEHFFDSLIDPDSTVLDLACGYGEFINNVRCKRKLAVDANPDARARLDPAITFYNCHANEMREVADRSVDTVFTSNFFEHLPSKETCNQVFREVSRVLVPEGKFIVMGPNIKYAYREYWDFYDHLLPFSDLSMAEGLTQSGFEILRSIPRFLPYTMNNSAPTADVLIRGYLSMPLAWRIFGKQFLIVARKHAG